MKRAEESLALIKVDLIVWRMATEFLHQLAAF